MKILVDMNLPPKLADMLTASGIEAVHWYNIGLPEAKDTEILSYAESNDYVVMTCDLDFSTIMSITHGQKPSVIQIRTQGYHSEKIEALIIDTVKRNAIELEKGAILTIDGKRGRLRLLPL